MMEPPTPAPGSSALLGCISMSIRSGELLLVSWPEACDATFCPAVSGRLANGSLAPPVRAGCWVSFLVWAGEASFLKSVLARGSLGWMLPLALVARGWIPCPTGLLDAALPNFAAGVFDAALPNTPAGVLDAALPNFTVVLVKVNFGASGGENVNGFGRYFDGK